MSDLVTADNDWRKGAHIEGVIAEHKTMCAVLEQCQKANGKLRAELKQANAVVEVARQVEKEEKREGRLYGRSRFDWRISEALDALETDDEY